MTSRAFITGISGTDLSAAEREFIGTARPWGFILFKRNVASPSQVTGLVQQLRDASGRPEAPVLIDQEGGRVQRFGRRTGRPIRPERYSGVFMTLIPPSA